MSIEQRLLRAFEQVDRLEPSDDLWSRVVHSIDEDRAHRRRLIRSTLAAVGVLLGLVAVGAMFIRNGVVGTFVEPEVLEILELVGLFTAVVVMGPAMRRFGRNYVSDLFPATPDLASMLLRLVDVAYYLVFAGYVLLTTHFEPGVRRPSMAPELAQQLQEAAIRFGGLFLLMGVLHAVTLFILPMVALVHNSTRRGRALPRWLRNLGVILVIFTLWQLVGALVLLLLIGTS
jgi:hypothetical protein